MEQEGGASEHDYLRWVVSGGGDQDAEAVVVVTEVGCSRPFVVLSMQHEWPDIEQATGASAIRTIREQRQDQLTVGFSTPSAMLWMIFSTMVR